MKTLISAAICLGALLATPSAMAATVEDFLARLNEGLAPIGARIDGTRLDGKTKSANVRMALSLVVDGETVPLGTSVTFDPIEEWDSDRLFAERIEIVGFEHVSDGVRGTADSIVLSYMLLPVPGEDNPYILSQLLGGLSIENLRVSENDDTLALDHFDYAIGVEPEYGSEAPASMAIATTIKGLLVDEGRFSALDVLENVIPKDPIVGQKVDLYLPLHWSVADGLFTISDASISVPTLGTLSTGLQIGGLTLPLLEELSKFGMAAAMGQDTDAAEEQAIGMKLLAGLTFTAGTIALADSGFVDALFDRGFAVTGWDDARLKEEIRVALGRGLGDLGIPEARIAELISSLMAFLDTGGTFALDAFPEQPASLIELVALARAPGALLDRVALTTVHAAPEVDASAAEVPAEPDFLARLAQYLVAAGGGLNYDFIDPATSPGGLMNFAVVQPDGTALPFSGGFVDKVEVLPGDILKSSLSLGGFSHTNMGVTA